MVDCIETESWIVFENCKAVGKSESKAKRFATCCQAFPVWGVWCMYQFITWLFPRDSNQVIKMSPVAWHLEIPGPSQSMQLLTEIWRWTCFPSWFRFSYACCRVLGFIAENHCAGLATSGVNFTSALIISYFQTCKWFQDLKILGRSLPKKSTGDIFDIHISGATRKNAISRSLQVAEKWMKRCRAAGGGFFTPVSD